MSARRIALLLRLLPPARKLPARPGCLSLVGSRPIVRRATAIAAAVCSLAVAGSQPTIERSGGAPAGVTWDAAHKGEDLILSNGDLSVTMPGLFTNGGAGEIVRSTTSRSTGKAYAEILWTSSDAPENSYPAIGLVSSTFTAFKPSTSNYEYLGGSDAFGPTWGCYKYGGAYHNDVYNDLSADIPNFLDIGKVGRIAVDFDAGKIWFGDEDGWSGDPAAGTGEALTFTPGTELWLAAQVYDDSVSTPNSVLTANFGATAFDFAAPSGFPAWQQ